MPSEPTDEQVVQYLLGELSDEERLAVQESLFRDNEVFDRLQDAETDLIDALARGELTAGDAQKVRDFVAASGQHARLNFARALASSETARAGGLRTQQAPATSGLSAVLSAASRLFSSRLILAFACGVLAVIAGWFWLQNGRLRQGAGTRTVAVAPSGPVFTFALPSGVVRGVEQARQVTIPAGTAIVQIELPIDQPGAYAGFSAVVKTSGGDVVWSESGTLAQATDRAALLIAAAALHSGRYEITLAGTHGGGQPELINYFYFVVR